MSSSRRLPCTASSQKEPGEADQEDQDQEEGHRRRTRGTKMLDGRTRRTKEMAEAEERGEQRRTKAGGEDIIMEEERHREQAHEQQASRLERKEHTRRGPTPQDRSQMRR
eukprot:42341-Heterocapsa_arctica.AAC.1